jgi:hypothetical protein
LVPVLHAATCTRFGHEQSQFFPVAGPGEWNRALECGELDRAIGTVLMDVGIGTLVLAVLVLLSVVFRGARWRLIASVSYGPVLVYIGIKGLSHADLHRWLWGSMSLVAGAVLTSFVGSYWLYRPRDSTGRRASSVAVFGAGALAVAFASLNLPAGTANRVLADSSLWWTYHRAEWKRDPYERIQGYQCTTRAGRCECEQTANQDDRATCGARQCCYRWDGMSDAMRSLMGGPSPRPAPPRDSCSCLIRPAAQGYCPEPGDNEGRTEFCP